MFQNPGCHTAKRPSTQGDDAYFERNGFHCNFMPQDHKRVLKISNSSLVASICNKTISFCMGIIPLGGPSFWYIATWVLWHFDFTYILWNFWNSFVKFFSEIILKGSFSQYGQSTYIIWKMTWKGYFEMWIINRI